MRTWITTAALGLAAMTFAGTADAAILFNETWESGTTGWTTNDSNPIVIQSDAAICSSKYQRETIPYSAGRVFSPAFPVSNTGGAHCLTAWVRGTTGTRPFVGLRMGTKAGPEHWLIGTSGFGTGYGGDTVTPVTSDNTWRWYTKSFTMEAGYTAVVIHNELWSAGSAGAADFDDLRLYSGACPTSPVGADHVACSGGTPACSSDGRCVACTDDSTCSGLTPRCDTFTNTCACLSGSDCSGTKPVCETTGPRACRACAANSECSGVTPTCLPSGGCGCTASFECPTATPTCNLFAKVCTSNCATDGDCGGPSSGRVCDGVVCVDGCRGSSGNGCAAGSTCSSTTVAVGTCSVIPVDAGTDAPAEAATDTAVPDTMVADTFVADTFVADTKVADTFVADTFVADTKVADTFVADTFVADTFVADSTVADSTVADTTVADSAGEDTTAAPTDTGTPVVETDSGSADAAADTEAPAAVEEAAEGGCGCSTPASTPNVSPLALLGLLLLRRRRR